MENPKSEARNPKQYQIINGENTKRYDLEDRTITFARDINDFIKGMSKTLTNIIYIKQLIRSSASVGANYIEANEALSRKDFFIRIKICRKEAKESAYWLKLMDINEEKHKIKCERLIDEANQLTKIFGAINAKA